MKSFARVLAVGAVTVAMLITSSPAHAASGVVYHYADTTLMKQWLNPGALLCKGMNPTPSGKIPRMFNNTNATLRVYTHPSCTGGYWTIPPGWAGNFYTGMPRGFVPLS